MLKKYRLKNRPQKYELPEWLDLPDQHVYSVKEIAAALKRHPSFVYRALRTAELEGIRLGKRTYIIPREALITWLKEYCILPAD